MINIHLFPTILSENNISTVLRDGEFPTYTLEKNINEEAVKLAKEIFDLHDSYIEKILKVLHVEGDNEEMNVYYSIPIHKNICNIKDGVEIVPIKDTLNDRRKYELYQKFCGRN